MGDLRCLGPQASIDAILGMQMADAFFSSAEPNHCLPSSAGSGRVGSGPFSHSHGSAAQNRRQTRPPSLESRSASAIRATALLLLDPKGLVSPWRDQATFTDSGTALVNAHRPRPDASGMTWRIRPLSITDHWWSGQNRASGPVSCRRSETRSMALLFPDFPFRMFHRTYRSIA
ncbi:hypothetical protein MPTK1_1g08850 [Marchantia polymorpha subsp. ruderalis]|uniref:Uncharacterized protein n=2 Tax=Marchantia polymorpha TaxID=3197 RepID=A0AAF6AN30_MARPO|nr:hypothetical protein MARPO_0036s0125 [Marchantia polymorpha]BBM97850.1 hypothetical protein Mp_1g08850 [Marchantia polymorpha subsp. ruderalis]|eukprot:PTQ41151.1 hypothetical protein MARPO_0036s0125 [Marchantia polymorpha]